MAADLARYEFAAVDGGDLPPFDAGAHIDIVIAPEYQRQYSLAGDPADRSTYVLGVLREPKGRGGSALMHRAFREGRRVFVTRPANHFPLEEDARHTLFFAGGIGVTPLIAMAHRLHALGRPFELPLQRREPQPAPASSPISSARPGAPRSASTSRTKARAPTFRRLLPPWEPGLHAYTCGAPRYMDGVFAAAHAQGLAGGCPAPRVLQRAGDAGLGRPAVHAASSRAAAGRSRCPPDRSATDVLAEAGIGVETKCSDGLCGVCATRYDAAASTPVEHRDFVLSRREREHRVILCCSRPADAGGRLVVDL